ncbi:MAG TPA: phosphoribosylglycinamide formyltransferase [Burkholderiaceae bacterium]|nr:phosphoribosylglycinamide formyltransferase [Burkholderiaceae bacterium]
MKRLAVLISGRGSNMVAIARAAAEQRWPARIVAVISNRADAAGLQWAQANDLPTQVVPNSDYMTREAFDAALADRIDGCGADLVVLAGFMRILTPALVSAYEGRMVNIHPSLLPSFPGLHTHRRALAAGVRAHGATAHFVTAAVDHGPIIAQAVVPVCAGDDEPALAARVLQAEHRLYPTAVRWVVEGRTTIDGDKVVVDGVDPAAQLLSWPLSQG